LQAIDASSKAESRVGVTAGTAAVQRLGVWARLPRGARDSCHALVHFGALQGGSGLARLLHKPSQSCANKVH
jgi:hypothetical protein